MKCNFLSTVDESVECSSDCELYKWAENNNKCPFTELKVKRSRNKEIYDYDAYKDDDDIQLSISNLYNDKDYI